MLEIDRTKPGDGLLQALTQRDGRLPGEMLASQRNVGTPTHRIVSRQRMPDDLGTTTREFDHQIRQLLES